MFSIKEPLFEFSLFYIESFMKSLLTAFLLFLSSYAFNQARQPKPVVKDSTSSDVFIDLIEQTLQDYYGQIAKLPNSETILNALEAESSEEISNEEICKRIKAMNELSSYKFECNAIVINAIKSFIKTRKSFTSIVLGRSPIYFDMYEEYLNKYDLPKNLKYLSVIESALSPRIKSRAGALGLWQFMYGTGKMYGLKDNSYFDERMDPRKSTDAACRYLKKLHEIYNDWNLALAAYNAGPGNVNRAIRRAGGKVSYWAIRPFLPGETQQYVPRFIATTYLFVYAKHHQIKAAPSPYTYYQLDTMCLKKGVKMEDISKLVDWSIDSIKYFNPVYKGTYIPKTEQNQCITGPLTYIGKLVSLEDSLYKIPTESDEATQDPTNTTQLYPTETTVYEDYTVKQGETLASIAAKFNLSKELLKQENRLTDENIKPNQVIKIPRKVISSVQSTGEVITTDTLYFATTVEKIHIVQRNENLATIAELYHVDKDSIAVWNDLDDKWINIGQKLIIHQPTKSFKVNQSAPKPNTTSNVPAPKPATPTATPQYHTVRSGELFNRIAAKYHLSVAQLQKLNPKINPNRITVGQKIRIK